VIALAVPLLLTHEYCICLELRLDRTAVTRYQAFRRTA
jgi:hypothetical protein